MSKLYLLDRIEHNINIIASQKGLSKTNYSILVALNYLSQNKKIMHISSKSSDEINKRYDDIIRLDDNLNKEKIDKNKLVLNFKNKTLEKIEQNILTVISEFYFYASAVFIDDINLSPQYIDFFLSLSKKINTIIWITYTIDFDFDNILKNSNIEYIVELENIDNNLVSLKEVKGFCFGNIKVAKNGNILNYF